MSRSIRLTITLRNHLTPTALEQAFASIDDDLRAATDKPGLIIDCTEMTGYDLDSRTAFVEWNRKHRDQICGVAIVTHNKVWHMVIRAMSLASKQQMRPFGTVKQAADWLATVA